MFTNDFFLKDNNLINLLRIFTRLIWFNERFARNTVFISYTLLSTPRLYIILHKRPLTSSIITHNNIHRNQPSYNIFTSSKKKIQHKSVSNIKRVYYDEVLDAQKHNSIKRQKNNVAIFISIPTITFTRNIKSDCHEEHK